MDFNKRISMAHSDATEAPDTFYKLFLRTSDKFKSEIKDIYFGFPYKYTYNGEQRVYGNNKDMYASFEQVEYLFKIQDEFGVEISLTFNDNNIPTELLNDKEVKAGFINLLKVFYDRGLRVCSIANTQLMNEGILQKLMPEMRWKNTINHFVNDSQMVIDYAEMGYDTIIINRTLHRDLNEIKKMRRAADYINKKYPNRKKIRLSILVKEGCMNNCPFRKIHDTSFKSENYITSGMADSTCSKWRANPEISTLPRISADAFWYETKDFMDYAEYIDDFKYTGRFSKLKTDDNFYWSRGKINFTDFEQMINSSNKRLDLFDIYDKFTYYDDITNYTHLSDVLKFCKGICWDCHKCEEEYNVDGFDSLIEVKK